MNGNRGQTDMPEQHPSRISWPAVLIDACRRIERSEHHPSLEALAEPLGVSPHELQRQFRRRLGVTPKQYSTALALNHMTQALARSNTTLDAAYAGRFQSASRAYEQTGRKLGSSPGRLKGDIDIGWWLGLSEMGWMLMGATERGICWLSFGDEAAPLIEELADAFPKARFYNDAERLQCWFDQVRDHILLPDASLELPLDIRGTAFQASVWQVLQTIPLGETRSYKAIAEQLGKPDAARAVASACARNRVALLIPCHRVVGSDGRLAGYRWGVARKRDILAREQNS